MNSKKKFVAIIPARSGSKRLPNKNKIYLNEKPLISWSIEEALKSIHLNQILVTSDCDEILTIAKKYNVLTLKRPKALCQDTSSSIDVVLHAIESMEFNASNIVLLQPTSPLRTSFHIDEAIEYFIKKNAQSVISVSQCEHPPLWTNTLPSDNSMSDFITDSVINKRSQDLPVYFKINGAIYIIDYLSFTQSRSFILKNGCFAYRMSIESSIDIDTSIDFQLASILMTKRNLSPPIEGITSD